MPSAQAQPATIAFPHLSQLEDQLFEAFASGITAPAALSARLNLPIKSILMNLATPAFLEAIHVLDSVTALLNRHTTRFRQQTAFQALEQALALATQAGNPAVMCRIATQLLKPTPPLPDAELEHVERAERITKSRRAVKDDAKAEAEAAQRPTKPRETAEEDAKAKAEIKAFVDAICPELTIEDIRAHRRAAQGATGDAGSEAAPVRSSNMPTPTNATPPLVAGHSPSPSPSHRITVSPSHAPAQPRAA